MSKLQWKPRRIVVGVDGSAWSIEALRWAASLCGGTDARIEATTCWQYPVTEGGMFAVPVTWDPKAIAEQIVLESVAKAFGEDPPAGLTTHVLSGHPAEALVEASAGADMLVVGTRGHGGFAGLLLGSVSAHCVEHARCPVTVTHDGGGQLDSKVHGETAHLAAVR